ncbi:MAG: amidohydrolase [Chloroflexota bacterium]
MDTPDDLIALRRDLHRHPELRFAEHRSAALMAERLAAAGFAVRTGVGGTGVVGSLGGGGGAGAHVMLRADLDAMPVDDEKDVPYRSTHPGVMHACGHDVHMSVVLTAAERLATAGLPGGRLTVVFQPAEERPFGTPSGAQTMLDDGVWADGTPDAVLGLHCWPDLPAGVVGVDDRIAMGAKDAFSIAVVGRGGHAATPSRARDAVLALADLVTALHAGVGRSLDATDRTAFNIGTIRGGRSQSVIAEDAELTGTIRTVDPEVRARLRAAVERITAGTAATHGVAAEVRWADEMPAVVNDVRLVRRTLAAAGRVLGTDGARPLSDPPMTADDFALFAQRAPAVYFKLGVARPGADAWPPLHSGHFDVDERCLGAGAAVMTELARDLLARGLEEGR